MNRRALVTALLYGSAGLAQQSAAPPSTTLKVGDKAPDFTLPSTEGGSVHIADFIGKSTVVLAFFPAAFTGGWTAEMKAYQAGMQHFQETGAKVFGISTDNTPSQKAFAQQLNLTFPLLSDFLDRNVSQKYGVYIAKAGVAGRVTFVIDTDGKIDTIESGGDAIKMLNTPDACSRLAHRKSGG
jgi:peroxiredoxin